jgi:hypothetical protein
MAIYKFKVSFEDYDDVIREIDIRSTQTFLDLHKTIHSTTGYDPEKSSSFYVSNDQWIKNEEIGFLPTQRKIDRGIALMENTKLNKFIDDPHQKFYYTYNFDRPYDFHVELMKILDEEKGKEYPFVAKVTGEAPKPLGLIPTPVPTTGDEEDFDFLDEEIEPEEVEDDFVAVDDLTLDLHEDENAPKPEVEEEQDEFMDEFSDTDNIDPDFHKEDDY